MRERMARFMYGRAGADELSKFESIVVMILLLIAIFTRWMWLDTIAVALCIHIYFRMFSKNIAKRRAENQAYVNFRYRRVVAFDKFKKRMRDRKIYRYYSCPMCKQKVRVPKGHGRISITCPKCREQFIRKS